jgi:hypothetical protein
MSDRPSAANGKRNRAWGTRGECPACGQCLCFGCHPSGPCVDEHVDASPGDSAPAAAVFSSAGAADAASGWYAPAPSGAAGLRMRAVSATLR